MCNLKECCKTCSKSKYCIGNDWFCKSCSKKQSECSIYMANKSKKEDK